MKRKKSSYEGTLKKELVFEEYEPKANYFIPEDKYVPHWLPVVTMVVSSTAIVIAIVAILLQLKK